MFWKFARALTAYIRAGCPHVSREAYAARLAACDACEARRGSICTECSCVIPLKAKMETEACPRERW